MVEKGPKLSLRNKLVVKSKKLINIDIAKKKKPSPAKFKIVALGFNKKGELVGVSTNRPRFGKKGRLEHAELRLIRKLSGIKKIVLIRIGRDGELRPIDPCEVCSRILNKLEIKVKVVSD